MGQPKPIPDDRDVAKEVELLKIQQQQLKALEKMETLQKNSNQSQPSKFVIYFSVNAMCQVLF